MNTQIAATAADDCLRDRLIMVVDDNYHVLRVMAAMLKRRGAQIVECETPEQCLEKCRAGLDVDLLISDVDMPNMTGPELRRAVAEVRPEVRAVFVTGGSLEAQLDGAPCLAKPFRTQELIDAVEDVLSSDADRNRLASGTTDSE